MTNALLPWHRDSHFKSEVLSADDAYTRRKAMLSYRTDAAAQVTKLAVITRSKRSASPPKWPLEIFLQTKAVQPKCQRVSLVLFIFATKMATESAVGREILWLTSAAGAVNAVCGETATPTGDIWLLRPQLIRRNAPMRPPGVTVK